MRGSSDKKPAARQVSGDVRRQDNQRPSEAKYDASVDRNRRTSGRSVETLPPPPRMQILSNSNSAAAGKSKGVMLQQALTAEDVGVVISLRPSFGFIQNIHSDDQLYFSENDVYAGVKVGDMVSFISTSNAKGFTASRVRFVDQTVAFEVLATKVLGTIARMPERHRSNCGLIDIDLPSLSADLHSKVRRKPANTIAYLPTAIDSSLLPKNVLLDRGDYVEFTLSKIPASNIVLATDIRLKSFKRDREREKAIQRMLDAGAVREIGVVTAVKNKEYGFIKAQDRKDELYFRMDGFSTDEDTIIREGTEVEFFVIAEMVRGKISDRAMHLKVIPAGTVQFEVVVARDVQVSVVSEPGIQIEETPGTGVLPQPVSVEHVTGKAGDVIQEVEVWQRCMPDEMICKRGDVLLVNVHYYRPEKLYFIRAVRLLRPFPLGRDRGTVIAIKDGAGFGFLTSESRRIDLYFRLNQVLSSSGEMLKKNEIVENLRVSFDVVVEGGKPRATRTQVIKAGEDDISEEDAARALVKSQVFGKVVRSTASNKKDSVGLIQISPELWREVNDFEFVDPSLTRSLQDFMSKMFLSETTIFCVSASLRKQLCGIIDRDFRQLTYEVLNGEVVDGAQLKHLRITKLFGGAQVADNHRQPSSASKANGRQSVNNNVPKDGFTIPYVREDYISEHFGPLGNDMEVVFDIVWDNSKGRKVAKRISLTDEEIASDVMVGIVDVIVDKGDKFGFIRVIPTFEKLFWHISSAEQPLQIKTGSFVSFTLRRRGGIRCATAIKVVEADSVPSAGQAKATAVVVDSDHVVVLDADEGSVLRDKFVNLQRLTGLIAENNPHSVQWNKGSKVPAAKGASPAVPVVPAVSSPVPSPVVAVDENNRETELMKEEDKSSSPLGTMVVLEGPLSESNGALTSSSSSSHRVEYQAKYFPHIEREPVPIVIQEGVDPVPVKVGDVVQVVVHLNWSKARAVTGVTVERVLSEVPAGSKKKGTITKLKYHFSALPTLSEFYNLNALDFAEITEMEEIPSTAAAIAVAAAAPPPNASTTGDVVPTKQKINYYYCEHNEMKTVVVPNGEYSRDGGNGHQVALDDEVEFVVVPSLNNLALAVKVLPRVQKEHNFNFQSNRQGINDKLKEMKSKVGTTNLISMAKGPPSDAAQGFEAGWRTFDEEAVKALPWAALFPTCA